ncbi:MULTISPECIES: glycosyltransferase [unclassified Rhodococcus (in: high G+C Gram-positive bacteria)]|uniref:glycosyltransferase n=1 Tax=unclassified Rhodococcus (in: high G+C Gram-positive bacteria) TaxID=192944 RepID=UPI0024B82450|nr:MULTISPECIES: glycosyltransferase [unclassified Rhodococcus (in: high G+C Gram-positive bacteria)]MDI9957810.1 glycosyltransferase [Rhodococcus sp. IEGM 1237]MDI9963265.1 glycosyltransferase [Rhodococcus sp. IEGM 1251]MDV8124838.1 glycosyltransferase [Rhodococcus sp. IEGM 1304]
MKVLHVTEALGGGVSTAILNYQALTPEMHHCVIARERVGQSTYNFPSELSVTLVPGSLAALLLSAIRMVRRGDFDILHLHSSLAGLARIIPGHRAGIVYTPHCYAFERTDVSPLARVLYKSVERGLLSIRRQCVVAVSGREAELTTELSNSSISIVVGNVSPTDHGGYLRASSHGATETSAERSRVVMVGRIFPQKDPQLFADIASRLSSRFEFVWVGDGEAVLKESLVESGVRVTGWIPAEQVLDEVRASSLYLHTAAWEGAPISAAEAAAVGVSVISRDIKSMVSLGYPVAGNTAESLSTAVTHYFDCLDYRTAVQAKTQSFNRTVDVVSARTALNDAYALARGVSR